jgi:hypothetical protein
MLPNFWAQSQLYPLPSVAQISEMVLVLPSTWHGMGCKAASLPALMPAVGQTGTCATAAMRDCAILRSDNVAPSTCLCPCALLLPPHTSSLPQHVRNLWQSTASCSTPARCHAWLRHS